MDKPHTPTPWEFVDAETAGTDMGGFKSSVDGAFVCKFGDCTAYYPIEGEPPCPADAQFIIKAVNSHASLTEAVRVLSEALEWYERRATGCRKVTSEGDVSRRELNDDYGQIARAALTTAKELTK